MSHNRKKSHSIVKHNENNLYDCFGFVGFENSTINLKIKENDFFDSKVNRIEHIPGFAFEESIEPEDNFFGVQTVIMLGFVFYLSSEDLKKAESTKFSKIERFEINSTAQV